MLDSVLVCCNECGGCKQEMRCVIVLRDGMKVGCR